MEAKNEPKTRSKKKSRKKIYIGLSVFVLVLVLIVLLVVPGFISSEKGRQLILSKVNNSIPGKADFGDLSMSWFKGIKLTDITFNDALGKISFTAKQVDSKPHYMSIIAGNMSFGKTIIQEPRVKIDMSIPQTRRFRRSNRVVFAGQTTAPAALPIERIDLTIKNGTVGLTGKKGKSFEFSKIDSHVNLKPPGKQTDFDINATVQNGLEKAKLHADGNVKPAKKTGWTYTGTNGQLTVKVDKLDLESLAPLFDLAGVKIEAKGKLSANIEGAVKDGQIDNIEADITGKDLDVTGEVLKSDRLRTKSLNIDVKLRREKDLFNIEKLDFSSDWANAQAKGALPTNLGSLGQFLNPKLPHDLKADFELDLAAALSQLPNTTGLKEGMSVTEGKITGKVQTQTKGGAKLLQGSVNLLTLIGKIGDKQIKLSQPVKADITIVSDDSGLNFDKLNLTSSFATLEAGSKGEILNYNARADLALLQSEMGQFVDIGPYNLKGTFAAEGKIANPTEKMNIDGTAAIENFVVSDPNGLKAEEAKTDINYKLGFDPESQIINVNSIRLAASLGQLTIRDSAINLNPGSPAPIKLTAAASKVNLSKLRPFMILFASFGDDIVLDGIVDAELNIASKNHVYTIKTDSAAINNFKVRSPGKEPFEQSKVSLIFDGDFDVKKRNRLIRKLQLKGDGVDVDFGIEQSVKGPNTTLQGNGKIDYDWAKIASFASAFIPEGLELKGRQSDNLTFSSTYPTERTDQILANLSTKAALGFEQCQYRGLNFSKTEMPITVEKGLLTIPPFTTGVNNGKLSFAAKADFKQEPTLLKVDGPIQIADNIELNSQIGKQLLMHLNPLFAETTDLSGKVSFNCEKLVMPMTKADKKYTSIIGTIAIDDLKLEAVGLLGQIIQFVGANDVGQTFRIRPTRFVLENDRLQYDNMQLDIGDIPVNFSGVIGPNGALDMTVTLPYTLKGALAHVDKGNGARRISLPLTGTIKKPELDTAKLIEQEAIKQGLDILEGLLR
jgi:hypothetical protein